MTNIEEIDNSNIETYKNIDFEEDEQPDCIFTCLMCNQPVSYKNCYSFEGHNLCCKNCVQKEIDAHIIRDAGMFMIKFIHSNKNIWDVFPTNHFTTI